MHICNDITGVTRRKTFDEGTVRAKGDLYFRGTVGISKEVPVGFQKIRFMFDLKTNASDEQRATLMRLTEHYCVVYRTRSHSLNIALSQDKEVVTELSCLSSNKPSAAFYSSENIVF